MDNAITKSNDILRAANLNLALLVKNIEKTKIIGLERNEINSTLTMVVSGQCLRCYLMGDGITVEESLAYANKIINLCLNEIGFKVKVSKIDE